MDKELDAMLGSGVIYPSTASCASPIVVVKKHDSSNRICIDFSKLNKITIFEPEPMSQMSDFFAELSGSQFFSKFDFFVKDTGMFPCVTRIKTSQLLLPIGDYFASM